MIIAVAAAKGGAGKSTVATNLAVVEAVAGKSVLLVDTDVQRSSSDWVAIREQENHQPRINFIHVTGPQTFDVLQERAQHFETVIVDCGGRLSTELQMSMAAAHVIAVPVMPAGWDAWAIGDTMKAVLRATQAVGEPIPTVAFVSRGSTNSKDREAARLIQTLQTVPNLQIIPERTSERKAYRDAGIMGLGVMELKPSNKKEVAGIEKAKEEIIALHRALKAFGTPAEVQNAAE